MKLVLQSVSTMAPIYSSFVICPFICAVLWLCSSHRESPVEHLRSA